jgi:hypothetical protein
VVYHIHQQIALPAVGRRQEQHMQRGEPRIEGFDGVLDGYRLGFVLGVDGSEYRGWMGGER